VLNEGVGMNDLTTSYFSIEKSDKQADGTLMVYGKATDDSVDIDQQICDAAWLDRAMPAWFKSGGNIREQHSSIAAGVAKEYESKADGHYIMAHVVDPVSVKKVDAGVLRGFSIGIKSPRVVRDNKAANGRIIDGQIVEVSLVDRPANPNCQLVLAKSVDGESSLIQVEELTDKHADHDQSSHGGGRGGAGGAGGASITEEQKAKVSAAKDNLQKLNDKVRSENTKTQTDKTIDEGAKLDAQQGVEDAQWRIDDAQESLKRASNAQTPKDYARNMNDAGKNMQAAGDHVFNTAATNSQRNVGEDLMIAGAKLQQEAINANKATDAEAIKHADHDQSSHGGGRGGGGGAGGGAAAEKPTSVKKQTVKASKELQGAATRADSIVSKKGDARMKETSNLAKQHADETVKRARSGDISGAKEYAERSSDQMQRLPEMAEKAGFSGAAVTALSNHANTAWNSYQTIYDASKKSTDAELRKALLSALQLLSLNKSEETPMKDSIVELPTKAVGDLLKFDKIQYEAAREALANLIAVEAGEMRDGHNELQSIAHLLEAVAHLHAWYEGEEAEGEVMEENEASIELAAKAEGSAGCDCKGCADCGKAGGCDKAMCGGHKSYKEAEADEDAEKSADLGKCLQCGCNAPGSDHGLKTTNDFANIAKPAIVTTAEMYAPGETPKSAEADETPTEEAAVDETSVDPAVGEAETENSEAPAEVDAADVEAIVEQVVKSATESLRAEIASLVAAKEARIREVGKS
jgi:hypothetical protein